MKNLYLYVLLLFSSLLSFSQIESGAIDITLECLNGGDTTLFDDWVASNGGAIASTDCGDVTWSYISSEFISFCSETGTVTYTATNDCGTEQTVGTVFFQDTMSPVLSMQADDMFVVCDGSGNTTELNTWLATNGGAFASDECSDVTWSNDFTNLNTDCVETVSVEVEFTASDDCGNQSTTLATFFIESTNSFCPDGPITLNSQAEVDAFSANYPNCTELEFLLSISGPDITNLNGLNGLTSCRGLIIQNNPLLNEVDGLNALTDLDFAGSGEIFIINNPSLDNLNGFVNAVNNAPIDLIIKDNPQLVSLNGLQSIQGYGVAITIENNNRLKDFNGLNGLIGVEDLFIKDNDSLNSFEGLNNMEPNSNTGIFSFINNDAISSIGSLNFVEPTDIIIRDNAILSDIDRFVNIVLEDNEFLYYLVIENNPNLSFCNTDYICSVIPTLETFVISNNAEGCNSIFDITDACQIAPFNDDITCSNYFSIPELILGETISASNATATASTYVPSCNDDVNRQDIWFILNLDANIIADIAVSNGFSLQLWEGNCSALTQVSDACATSLLQDISLIANTFYFLQVWFDDSGRSTLGDFEIIAQDATLALSDFDLDNFKLFPNPFKDQLNLSYTSNIENVYIYDIQGKLVESLEINAMNATLNLSEYESGMYFLKLVNEDFSATRKIIKQ